MICASRVLIKTLFFQLVDALKEASRYTSSEKQLSADNRNKCLLECRDHSDRDAIPMGGDAREDLIITGWLQYIYCSLII